MVNASIEQSNGEPWFETKYFLWAINQDHKDVDCNIVDSKEDANMQKGLKN